MKSRFERRDNGTVRIRLTLDRKLADSLERQADKDNVTVIDAIYMRLRGIR